MALSKNIRFKLSIQTLKDAENARQLYNRCVLSKSYTQAIQVAKALANAGFRGWNEKVATLRGLLAKG